MFCTYSSAFNSKSSASRTIATFNTITKAWKKGGEMIRARNGHGVIVNQGDFVIFGSAGEEHVGVERCTLKGDSIECQYAEPRSKDFFLYPEMINVPHDYCPYNPRT